MLDYMICGGHVMDPASGVSEIRDAAVKNGRIVDLPADPKASNIIDSAGCFVFPGMIDAHAHSCVPSSGLGVQPDFQADTGVTTVLDTGTAGWSNYPAFHLQ